MNDSLRAATPLAATLLAISHHGYPMPPAPLRRLVLAVLLVLAPLWALCALPSLASADPESSSALASPGSGSGSGSGSGPASGSGSAVTKEGSSSRYSLRPSLMAGLLQWTLFGGGNVAGQVKVQRLVFEYSHGQALHYDRFGAFAQTAAERDAGVEVESPWTTGGGVGYQITPNLHLMIELKAHHYLVRDSAGATVEYTTFTAGPGLFYDWYLTEHFFVQPNVRWWPTLASTYDADEAVLMSEDGGAYPHERHDLLPFVNVNLGWTFDAR